MKNKYIVACLLITVQLLVVCCSNSDSGRGKPLAERYCQGCHMLPDAAALDKKTWADYVLPKMGSWLGFRRLPTGGYVENGREEILTLGQWEHIVSYYIKNSPAKMPARPADVDYSVKEIENFQVEFPSFAVQKPAATLVKWNENDHGYFIGDGLREQLYRLADNGTLIDSCYAGRGISHLRIDSNRLYVLTMGVLHPSDARSGRLMQLDWRNKKSTILIDSLQRPVHASYADLNQDGMMDIVICEFGNETGRLAWFEGMPAASRKPGAGRNAPDAEKLQTAGDKVAGSTAKAGRVARFIEHTLRALPGAVRTEIIDLNQDGKPDILALMAQGDEGIFVYFNEGNGNFTEKRLLQFPPYYGSNYFELADFNQDGFPDILATHGDNGDYPPVLKNYHGIRIYFNDGRNNFKESRKPVFLPMYGASKAMARDFDRDGDIDIASIAYFPDYENRPREAFIYWKNDGHLNFSPYTFKDVTAGRWLTMDAADADGDGDLDLLLGNAWFTLGDIPKELKNKWDTSAVPAILLRNKLN